MGSHPHPWVHKTSSTIEYCYCLSWLSYTCFAVELGRNIIVLHIMCYQCVPTPTTLSINKSTRMTWGHINISHREVTNNNNNSRLLLCGVPIYLPRARHLLYWPTISRHLNGTLSVSSSPHECNYLLSMFIGELTFLLLLLRWWMVADAIQRLSMVDLRDKTRQDKWSRKELNSIRVEVDGSLKNLRRHFYWSL